jgi:hypothetical protein
MTRVLQLMMKQQWGQQQWGQAAGSWVPPRLMQLPLPLSPPSSNSSSSSSSSKKGWKCHLSQGQAPKQQLLLLQLQQARLPSLLLLQWLEPTAAQALLQLQQEQALLLLLLLLSASAGLACQPHPAAVIPT